MRTWQWIETRWQHIFRAAVFTIIVVGILLAVFGNRRPSVGIESHVFTSPPPFRAGAKVTVQWEIKDLRTGLLGESCTGVVYVIWIDSVGKSHPAKPFPVPIHAVTGKPQTFSASRKIPDDMPPGEAIYTVTVDRGCNPLQQFLLPMREKLPEIRFTVAPPQ